MLWGMMRTWPCERAESLQLESWHLCGTLRCSSLKLQQCVRESGAEYWQPTEVGISVWSAERPSGLMKMRTTMTCDTQIGSAQRHGCSRLPHKPLWAWEHAWMASDGGAGMMQSDVEHLAGHALSANGPQSGPAGTQRLPLGS